MRIGCLMLKIHYSDKMKSFYSNNRNWIREICIFGNFWPLSPFRAIIRDYLAFFGISGIILNFLAVFPIEIGIFMFF